MSEIIKQALSRAVQGEHLDRRQAAEVMAEIMSGRCSDLLIGALLVALRMKGETEEEITGFAQVMRERAVRLHPSRPVVDTCGTGGAPFKTFNVSTVAAFVAAGAGQAVAKHGNRSATRSCGSADLIEAMGIDLNLPPERVERCIDQVGIGFLFAPAFHPSMKYAIPARREMGIRTVFNILGPLTNPAGAAAQVLGVFDPKLAPLMAGVLRNLGSSRALVVHASHGFDEFSVCGETQVTELRDGRLETYTVVPEDFGLARRSPDEIKGGSVQENLRIAQRVLSGEPGTPREMVLLNSAAALVVGGRAADFQEGLALAAESVDSGQAGQRLEELRRFCSP